MRFFAVAFGFLATLTLSAAQTTSTPDQNPFIYPTAGAKFAAGQTSTLTWTPSTKGTVSLRLQWGATTVESDGIAIASSITNSGTYAWDVPTNIPEKPDYFIRISSDSDPSVVNYSARFSISGLSGSSTTAASSTTAMSTTSASSTSTSASSTSSSTSTSSSSTTSSTSSTSTTMTTMASSTSAVPSSTSASSTTTSASTSTSASSTASSKPSTVPNLSGAPGAFQIPSAFALAGIAAFGAYALL